MMPAGAMAYFDDDDVAACRVRVREPDIIESIEHALKGCALNCAHSASKTIANGSIRTGLQAPVIPLKIKTIANHRTLY
jgi:hypothetical protein